MKPESVVDLFPQVRGDLRVEWLRKFSVMAHARDMKGNVAECGVYRGDFAKYINEFFFDRKCYLFDSFEGFCQKDIRIEHEKNPSAYASEATVGGLSTWLKDTSVDVVMDKMPYPNMVVIKKGYIPETFEGIDETFCFVNLDVDLYQPAYEGINFFYPRMINGGVILVHDCYDYNKKHIVEQAIYDYERKEGVELYKIPCADYHSLAIIKY